MDAKNDDLPDLSSLERQLTAAAKEIQPAPGAALGLVTSSWGEEVPGAGPALSRTWLLHIRCLERAGLGNVLRAEVQAYVRAMGHADDAGDEPRSDEWKLLDSAPPVTALATDELSRLSPWYTDDQTSATAGVEAGPADATPAPVTAPPAVAAAASGPAPGGARPFARRALTRLAATFVFAASALLPIGAGSPPQAGAGIPAPAAAPVATIAPVPEPVPALVIPEEPPREQVALTGPVPVSRHQWRGLGGKRQRSIALRAR